MATLTVTQKGTGKEMTGTLEAICRELGCQPGDILEYRDE